MRRWIACLVLTAVLTSAAWCEQVYIRNKPYKGAVSGAGASTRVELQPLVTALGLKATEVQGNWVVTAEGETASLPEGATGAGQIYFQGKPIGAVENGTVALIPTAQGLGAVAKVNKDMGSIDVNLPVKQIADTPPTARPQGQGQPDAPVASSGGYKMVHFWASW